MPLDNLREDVPASSGVLDPTAIGQDDQRRLTPRNGAKPKWPGHELSLQRSHLPRAAAQVAGSGTGRRRQGAAIPSYPGLAHRQQRAGMKTPTQFRFGKVPDRPSPDEKLSPEEEHFAPTLFAAGLPATFEQSHGTRLMAGNVVSDLVWSPGAVLIDTVARLQLDMEELRSASLC